MSLAGRTVFITGYASVSAVVAAIGSVALTVLAARSASRGIGHAIAVRCAREGANVAIAAKTAKPHPKLPG